MAKSAERITSFPDESSSRFHRILVAVDGSRNSERASRVAVDLAGKFRAELTVLHVVPRVSHAFVPVRSTILFRDYYLEEKKAAMKWLDKVVSLADRHGVKAVAEVRVAAPSVSEAIVGFAARKTMGLIVIGTRGLGTFRKLVMGSVSSGVVAHAHCPVLLVR